MDPQGVINLAHVANAAALPAAPYRQYAYRKDDVGEYVTWDAGLASWADVDLRISDEVLNDLIDEYGVKGAIKHAITPIMAAVLNEMSIAQISNGIESTQYQSIEAVYQFYKGLQTMYAEEADEEVGYSTGRTVRTRRPVIGGVFE